MRARALWRFALYGAIVAGVAATLGLLVGLYLDAELARSTAIGLWAAGGILLVLPLASPAGPALPDTPGLEREYLRHVHVQAGPRRAWQSDNLVLALLGLALFALGALIDLAL